MRSPHSEWESLYARFGEELEGFVRFRVPVAEAEDVLQDIWASLAGILPQEPPDHPRAWLYRVARNRIADLYRSRSVTPSVAPLEPGYDPADAPSPTDPNPDHFWQRFFAALATLPATQREVFERNELDGETLREIAADLGVPLKTAISRKGYARHRLQELLRETYDEYLGLE